MYCDDVIRQREQIQVLVQLVNNDKRWAYRTYTISNLRKSVLGIRIGMLADAHPSAGSVNEYFS